MGLNDNWSVLVPATGDVPSFAVEADARLFAEAAGSRAVLLGREPGRGWTPQGEFAAGQWGPAGALSLGGVR